MFEFNQEMSDDEFELSIPLPTRDDERKMNNEELPPVLPILALRNTVLYPGVVLPITVGRDNSLALVRDTDGPNERIGVVAQVNSDVEDPTPADLSRVGTVAVIRKRIKMPDGTISVVIQGQRRFKITQFIQEEPYMTASVQPFNSVAGDEIELIARMRSIKDMAVQIVNLSPNLPSEAAFAIQNIDSPSFLIHFIASNLQIDLKEKQELLEIANSTDQADRVLELMANEMNVLQLSAEIRNRVKTEVDQQQREFLLRQQLKTIQEELGEEEPGLSSELAEVKQKLKDKNLPEEVKKITDKELKKLMRTNPAAPDYSVMRNYLDWIIDLPWEEFTEDQLDIKRAAGILDDDHYGLAKVKRRILEYLAVLKLKGDMKAPILCFYGPPGVGKTSLGKSIANSLGRKFIRMSLGGVHDEAEIRGHRRTYIGAMPGRILQGIKKAGSANPVFMLDEIDKIGKDFRGDPSSALLEVLDPEQNNAFNDHYLEVDYDLSRVMFVATANSLGTIPPALRDRMEIIEINGYTVQEKLAIAQKYLLPRQIKENGLKASQISVTKPALRKIIEGYTRESGVRQLERTIGSVARNVAKRVAMEETESDKIGIKSVEEILGAARFTKDVIERTEVPGVATGLAWTPVGGDILFIESSMSRGTGRMILTGQLGDVMKESAQAALSYIKSNIARFDIPYDALKHWDLHIHVPAGGIPKDGPSAGVAMFTSILSNFTQRKVQHTVAMTGEITLRGAVLPVGGIKEKVLAAKRAGIETILLPAQNKKDVEEIESNAIEGLTFIYLKRIEEAIPHVLTDKVLTDPVTKFVLPDNKNQGDTGLTGGVVVH